MNNNTKAQVQVDAIVVKLTNSDIERVEILHISSDVRTRTRITQVMLEQNYIYKFTIRDILSSRYSKELLAATKSIAVHELNDMPDLRWGIIYFDANNNRVGAIYLDKTGKRGAVGNTPVEFKGNFFKWLERNFSKCFR